LDDAEVRGLCRIPRNRDIQTNVRYWHLADTPVVPAFVRFWTIADKGGVWPGTVFPLMTQSGHSGDFPQDNNHVVLERAGGLDSDRWGSTSFSLAEGANGGDTSAPVTAMICCWHASPSAMIRSNAPPTQS
jgi:hypothetical protein